MARRALNLGMIPNDRTGDKLRDAFKNVEDNTSELYQFLGGNNLTKLGARQSLGVPSADEVTQEAKTKADKALAEAKNYADLKKSEAIKHSNESSEFRSDFYDDYNDDVDSYFVSDKDGFFASNLGGSLTYKQDFYDDSNDDFEILILSKDMFFISVQSKTVNESEFTLHIDFYDDYNNSISLIRLGNDGFIIEKVEHGSNTIDEVSSFVDGYAKNDKVYSDAGLIKNSYTLPIFYKLEDDRVINSAADVYAFFDNLMNEFPLYISRVDRGAGSDGAHIFEYVFTPPQKRIDSTEQPFTKPSKILLTAGIHGSERVAMIALMGFCYQLCYNFDNHSEYSKLRGAVQFVIVPILNPSGLNSRSRYNKNGVDLNRNFPADWEKAEAPKGTAALSELESQIALDIINAHPDMLCNLSLHGHGLIQSWFWAATMRPWTLHLSNRVLNEMYDFYHANMPFETDPNLTITYLGDNTPGTFDRHIQKVMGKSSILLEFGVANSIVGNSIFNVRVLAETMIYKTAVALLETQQNHLILNSYTQFLSE